MSVGVAESVALGSGVIESVDKSVGLSVGVSEGVGVVVTSETVDVEPPVVELWSGEAVGVGESVGVSVGVLVGLSVGLGKDKSVAVGLGELVSTCA